MKVKNLLIGLGVALVIAVIAGAITIGIVIPSYHQIQLEKKFPPGTSVGLKNLDIKGNVSKYTDHGVDIFVIDKMGQAQILSVEPKLLTK